MIKEPILNYWYRALASPFGIEVSVSDVEKDRARLYNARREAKDPDLEQISITISRFDPMRLWLRKRGADEKA